MTLEQVGLQLGIAGLLVVVGYRVAVLLISNWRSAEAERTAAISTALTTLSGKVENHHVMDIQSHSEIAEGVAELRGKLDEAIGWQERTPVGGGPMPERATPPPGLYSVVKRPGTKG